MRNLLSWIVVAGLACALAGVGSMVLAAGKEAATPQPTRDELAAGLQKTFDENLAATRKEDVAAVMATVHADSPGYAMNEKMQKQLFSRYNLNYEVVSFRYLGRDGRYAFARVKQRTTKVTGPAFRDNELDSLQVFRKDEKTGRWKFWTSANLEITFLPGAK